MNNDPLFFLKDPTLNTAVKQGSYAAGGPVINPLHFILNIIFVLVIIYLTILLLKLINQNKTKPHSYVLKEISLNPTLKVLYVKINKTLYLLAQTNNQVLLLDSISNQKDILQALTENEEEKKPLALHLGAFLPFLKKSNKLTPEFNETLKTIIQNSEDIEGLNKK